MKCRKASITGPGLALLMGGAIMAGCSAADTVSVAPKNVATGGSSGASTSGTAGTSSGAGTGGSGGTSPAAGGSVDPSTGGGAGVAIDMMPDASGGDMSDAPSEAPPALSCPNAMTCLKMTLVHRYSFDGTGTVVTDTVGTAHGKVVNGTLSGNGDVVLAGTAPAATATYVDLPNGIIKQLTSATIEAWVTWTGGLGWQRLFDFGNSGGAEDTQSSASTTFYLTPQAGGPNALLAAFKRMDQTYDVETRAVSIQMVGLATGAPSHVAVVIDPAHTLMTLYRNGMPDGSILFTDSLSLLNDVNNWLGRSQYGGDPAFAGTLQEFRIYNAALPPDVILASFTAGPTATF